MNAAQLASRVGGSFNLNLGSLTFSPSYLQAGLAIGLIFLLLLTLASVRRHFLEWSFKGAFFGVFFGILIAFLIEGFLIVGGKTALTEVLGWKNAPAPLLSAIDLGRTKLINVLGVSTEEIPGSVAKERSSFKQFIENYQTLSPIDAGKVKAAICKP